MRLRSTIHLFFKLVRTVRNWPLYILNRFGWIHSETLTYVLRSGTRISTRPFAIDRSALNDVWLEESYEPKHAGIEWDWTRCRTIVDIGANIGTFTLFAAEKSPHARIVAVEPEPGNFSVLTRNIEENNLAARVSAFQVAIGQESGTATLHIDPRVSGGHSLFRHGKPGGMTVTVPTTTLEGFFRRHHIDQCDYLKLDCEGAEYDALYGLPRAMLQSIRAIAVECHYFSADPKHTGAALCTYLQENAFDVRPLKKSMYIATRDNMSN